MENRNTTTVVLGTEQNKISVNNDIILSPSLEQNQRELLETDRNSVIALNEVFDRERQASTTMRLTFNVDFFYDNLLMGTMSPTTGHHEFLKTLYRHEPVYGQLSWSGRPQHHEFDLIREDRWTGQFQFEPRSASTYNWSYYVTYPVDNVHSVNLMDVTSNGNVVTWNINNGLLGSIEHVSVGGLQMIRITSPLDHGLSEDDHVELIGIGTPNEFAFSGQNIYKVRSLGDGTFTSTEKVFNIVDIGYPVSLFSSAYCTFKRVIDPDNRIESTSKYYIRRHEVLLTPEDLDLTYNGFQENPYKERKQYEFPALTVDNLGAVKTRNGTRSYNINNNKDINISPLKDNNGKPLTELFLSFLYKGYGGWFNKREQSAHPPIKGGWEFNMVNVPYNEWWRKDNQYSDTSFGSNSYSIGNKIFWYIPELVKGDRLLGDICEYNDEVQVERVVSRRVHKIRYNQDHLNVNMDGTLINNNLPGLHYQCHFPVKVREFSDYIETSENDPPTYHPPLLNYSGNTFIDIPPHAFFSSYHNEWRWRDLYTYGYIDENGNGVDHPFLNGAHYATTYVKLRLYPDKVNYDLYDGIIENPSVDECE